MTIDIVEDAVEWIIQSERSVLLVNMRRMKKMKCPCCECETNGYFCTNCGFGYPKSFRNSWYDGKKNSYPKQRAIQGTVNKTYRKESDKNVAIERAKQAGAFLVSTEMVIFQLIEKAGTEEFRKISMIVK